ncbi:MAG: UvrD-helicase domain-containing protein [Muribaculaceae bacterium]
MLNIQKASAGSGKTYTLVKEYIILLLGYKDENGVNHLHNNKVHESHRAILAVTFTNKATNEMKERIVRELSILADKEIISKSPYLKDLCTFFNTTQDEVCNVAKKALWELLHDFTSFNVSTLDSFFQNILRTFAREAEVAYNYNIELRDEYAVRVGVNNLVSSLNRNSDKDNRQLHNWLKLYLRNQVENGKSWNIFSDSSGLQEFAKQLSSELFKRFREELNEYLNNKDKILAFQKELSAHIDNCIKDQWNVAQEFYKLLIDNNLPSEGLNSRGHIFGFTKIVETKIVEMPLGFYKISDDCNNWFTRKYILPDDLSYNFIQQIIALANRVNDIKSTYLTYEAMRKDLFALGLLGDISKNIEDFRKENDIILLSDTNELLHKIISEDDTPFIYERVGIWIKHFLIDEFQDTSKMQWINMKPLLSESLANSNESLIIGDEKQSIYRFRNADPSLLQKQVFIDFNGRIANNDTINRCSTNWRSAANIVKFNNTLFSILPGLIQEEYESSKILDTYSNVIQLFSSKEEGHVKVEFINNDKENSEKWTDVVLQRIPILVDELIQQGYHQNDIAILVNKRVEGEQIIDAIFNCDKTLIKSNLEVISDEALLLRKSPAIRLIISILRYLDNATPVMDNHSEVKETPEEKDLRSIPILLQRYENSINEGKNIADAFAECFDQNNNDTSSIDSTISLLNNELSSLVLTTEAIIRKYIKPRALEAENAYLQAFQDIVIDFTAHNTSSIHLFLKWWDSHSDKFAIASPTDLDAINVMTIHKSKGLEFPCVIIPFCNWELNQNRGYMWTKPILPDEFPTEIIPPILPIAYEKGLLDTAFKTEYLKNCADNIIDTLNKTYVAFTRASKEMFIFAPSNQQKERISLLPSIDCATPEKVQQIKDSIIDRCNDNNPDIAIALKEYINNDILEIGSPIYVSENNSKKDSSEMFTMTSYAPCNTITGLKYDLPDTLNENPRTKGTLLHKVLSMIKYESDIPRILKLCKARGIINEDDAKSVFSIIIKGLQNQEAQMWFIKGNRVLNERTITKDGNTYRPDRIIVTPSGETIIIDYKFGAMHSPTYHTQVQNYISLIRDAGHQHVTGKIWYPLENLIETITV